MFVTTCLFKKLIHVSINHNIRNFILYSNCYISFFVARKIWIYKKTPAPLKIPTTPAPTTRSGVAFRMVKELTVFESLFKSNKWIWLFGWIFHFGLFLVLLRHLRYFTDPYGDG